jgi:hypothetical protein
MTDEDYQKTFEALRQMMLDSGLSWVVTQVDEEIRFGRTAVKRISVRPEPPEELALIELVERTRTAKVNVSATRPYTKHEQLGMLLDALERTVGGINDMEEALRTYFAKQLRSWDLIRCVRTDEDRPRPVSIGRVSDTKRDNSVADLRRLMGNLRGMM